jgi:lipid-A-disaccharide synthase
MRPYVDRILCLLPFEPDELARLGGPPGVFVGHRLSGDPGVLAAARMQAAPRDPSPGREKTLLLLPGSRRGEVRRLIEPFGDTVSVLRARGHRLRLLLPTVPHVAQMVREAIGNWPQQPEVVLDAARKWQAFGEADAALIASGTVSLELALSGVPMISCYKLDPVMRMAQGMVRVWSGVLPNLVADRPIVPEAYNRYVQPVSLARYIEALWDDTLLRQWQKNGFAEVRRLMDTDRPAGEIAAGVVMELIEGNRAAGQ